MHHITCIAVISIGSLWYSALKLSRQERNISDIEWRDQTLSGVDLKQKAQVTKLL